MSVHAASAAATIETTITNGRRQPAICGQGSTGRRRCATFTPVRLLVVAMSVTIACAAVAVAHAGPPVALPDPEDGELLAPRAGSATGAAPGTGRAGSGATPTERPEPIGGDGSAEPTGTAPAEPLGGDDGSAHHQLDWSDDSLEGGDDSFGDDTHADADLHEDSEYGPLISIDA